MSGAGLAPRPTSGLTIASLVDAVSHRCAGALNAAIGGDPAGTVASVAPLEVAGVGQLAFLASARYRDAARACNASALVLTDAERAVLFPAGRSQGATLACDNPYAWFALAAQVLHPVDPVQPGRHPTAQVDATALVDPSARIDALAVIGPLARVAPGAWVGSGSFVGAAASVGAGTRLHAAVTLQAGCELGARCIVHSGAVIGADGFGFAPLAGRWLKIPQIGRVLVDNDVEIGAGTTIDRGTMGDTLIAEGVKIDNQVQIAHNCRIGAHTVIAGCVGIAGSATIGDHCQLGGAAMVAGHLEIAAGTVVGAGTLVSRTIRAPGFYTGFFPMMLNRDWERNAALLRHLVELRDRVKRLELQLERVQPQQVPPNRGEP